MTRNDGLASSRPQLADAAPTRRGSVRALGSLILSVSAALALVGALLMPTAAVAAEGTTGYGQTPTPPTTTTQATTTPTPAATTPTPTSTTPAPKTGTLPSKESSKPKSTGTPAPATTKTTATTPTTPTATTAVKKATTLPFTGLDLRWVVGIGLLMMGAGFWIVTAQLSDRRDTGR
jgi:hypothetical protein